MAGRFGLEICEQTSQRLVLRDVPGRVWAIRLFLSFFVISGLVCLGLVLGVIGTQDRPLKDWEIIVGLVIGLGVMAGGLVVMGQSPRSHVVFDRQSGTVAILRSGPLFGRQTLSHALADIVAVEVRQTGTDSDGDPVHEAFLELRNEGGVTLTCLGPGREDLERTAALVRRFLGKDQGPRRL